MSLNLFMRCPISVNVKKSFKQQLHHYRLCYKKYHFSASSLNKSAVDVTKNEEQQQQVASNDSSVAKFRGKLLNGPNLKDFFRNENLKYQEDLPEEQVVPYLQDINR